ncbi:MAG: cupin [Aerococcus viridans]|nr:MAG: cupin [Aerococcus viridans]
MKDQSVWIEHFNMEGHDEGGYFYQVLKSDERVQLEGQAERALYTSIYFLLKSDNPYMITPEGNYETIKLGLDVEDGQVLQAVVPKNTIFGSSVEDTDTYSLVSCMVSPGFEYEDFELFTRTELIEKYPDYQEMIKKLTLPDAE